jgi:hypothetical protein
MAALFDLDRALRAFIRDLPTQEPIVVLLTIKEEKQFSQPLDARLKIAAVPRLKV